MPHGEQGDAVVDLPGPVDVEESQRPEGLSEPEGAMDIDPRRHSSPALEGPAAKSAALLTREKSLPAALDPTAEITQDGIPSQPEAKVTAPSPPASDEPRPMDLDEEEAQPSAQPPPPAKAPVVAITTEQEVPPIAASPPGSQLSPTGHARPASPMDIEEESQIPIREASPDEPWGMDLDVDEPLDMNADALDGAAAALDTVVAPPEDEAAANARETSLPLVSDAVEQERQPAVAPLPSTLPSVPTTSSPPKQSSQRTVVSTPRPPVTTGGNHPTASSQRMPPPSSPLPPRPPTQRPASQRPPPSPSPDALDLLAANGGTLNAPAIRPPTPQRPDARTADDAAVAAAFSVDPALLQFRFARTFRTRTALQLQPYTKEKQLYESALRKGGLSKGRRAVAPSAEVRAANDQDETQEGDSTTSDSDATPPDAIVIGATQEEAPRRQREPKPLVDADYDEYFLQFGEVADEEEPLCQRRLQVIARQRLRQAREARRKERAAERTRRGFEALMKETERDKDEVKSKETEKRAAQAKSATDKRKSHSRKGSANEPQRKDHRNGAQSNGATKASSRTNAAEKTKRASSNTVRRDRHAQVGPCLPVVTNRRLLRIVLREEGVHALSRIAGGSSGQSSLVTIRLHYRHRHPRRGHPSVKSPCLQVTFPFLVAHLPRHRLVNTIDLPQSRRVCPMSTLQTSATLWITSAEWTISARMVLAMTINPSL